MSERDYNDMNQKKCINCKYYNGGRRNEEGLARCARHPFWVKDDEACESFETDYETKETIVGMTIKEKIVGALGTFGFILYFIVQLLVSILPFLMIGGGFFFSLLLISIHYFVPITSVIFWIWGLVCAIKGVQDIWAVIYYIAFVVIWIPFYINVLTSLFKKN